MIIVMHKNSTSQQLLDVEHRIEKHGLTVQISQGVERTIIGVLGQPTDDLREELERVDGVSEVIRVSKPYKLASREFHPENTLVQVGNVVIGGDEVVVMAGPCAIEIERQLMDTAEAVIKAGATILRGGAFKPRTSPYSFQGLGVEGLALLQNASKQTGLPIVTEIVTPEDADTVANYADILQIGARNAQNYRLLDAVATTNKPILLKHGLATTYEEWLLAAERIMDHGNSNVIMCQRGIRTFESYTRFALDLASVPSIKSLSHLPIVVDPSHSSGRYELVIPMALASVAAGAHGLIVEVHPEPDQALCDGAQALTFGNFSKLMTLVKSVSKSLK